ncbi:divergent polysaccharide deacetylase family protein [Desulfovibrio sp. OttesenSCG-928-C06]|nr:divergent polysaccharide deacetylase family protein [Desulfovibrio sp. OttesenSCG-928-C06]
MRINVSKGGILAGVIIVLTVLSLLFLLVGDNGQSRQPGTSVEARQLILQAALREVMPAMRRSLGPSGLSGASSASGSFAAGYSAQSQSISNQPASSLSAPSQSVQSSFASNSPNVSGQSCSAGSSPLPASHRTDRQLLAPPAEPNLNAAVSFKKASDQLLVFAETLILKHSSSGTSALAGGNAPTSSGADASGAPAGTAEEHAGANRAARQEKVAKPVLESPEGLVFEESLAPSLSDEVAHVDFALAQSLRRLELPESAMLVELDEVRDEDGAYYHFKRIRIYAGADAPLFINTLRDSLLAWADGAVFVRASGIVQPDGGVWQVFIDEAHTHTFFIHSGTAPGVSGQGTILPDDSAPRLVIVLDDLGESPRQARFLLDLAYPVTFAVWPRSTHATAVAKMATAAGAELIIHQPMEPIGYPDVNPGRGAMLFKMTEDEALAVLRENLRRVPGAQGLNNHMGSWLTQNGRLMAIVSRELKRRDMFALDSLTHARSQFARAAVQEGALAYRRDVFLDVQPEKAAVLRQLGKAEQIARLRGQAVAIGHPLPGTLAALEEWQNTRDKSISIVRLRDLRPLKK